MNKAVLLTILLIASSHAQSKCSEWPPRLNKTFRNSDRVVVAEVTGVKKLSDFNYRADYTVIEAFKGGGESGFVKFQPSLSTSLRMRSGEKYILFIRYDFEYYVTMCSGSINLRESDWKIIHKLRQLSGTIRRVGYGHHHRHHYRYQ